MRLFNQREDKIEFDYEIQAYEKSDKEGDVTIEVYAGHNDDEKPLFL